MTRYDATVLIARTLGAETSDTVFAAHWKAVGEAWPTVLEVASEQRVATALYTRLLPLGYAEEIAEEFREMLGALRLLAEERNATVLAQAAHAAKALNSAGITPVLLKGAGHLASGLHEHPADRLVGDLDLLVPAALIADAVHALTAAGYTVQSPDLLHADGASRVDVHYPPMQHPDWPLLVELHWAVLPRPLGAALPTESLLARAERIPLEGAEARVLCAEDALLYNILHAEARHHAARAQQAPLWQLYDSLLLSRRASPAAWGHCCAAGPANAVYVRRHLALLRAFFGLTPTPESAEWSLDRVATWRLRHGINRDRIGRADAALCAMLAAIGSEAESLLRQGRQGELLRKLYSPRALGRRLRNILTRLRKVFAS